MDEKDLNRIEQEVIDYVNTYARPLGLGIIVPPEFEIEFNAPEWDGMVTDSIVMPNLLRRFWLGRNEQ